MASHLLKKFVAAFVFYTGLLIMVLGISFLFGFLEGISRFSVFLSFLFVLSGAFFAFLAIKLNRRASYLFFASFLMMVGIYLFISALGLFPLPFSQAWPLLSVFSGLALFPAGWRRYGSFRTVYMVPSISFIALGCILLVFSFKMVPFSFRYFIFSWWPLIFIFGGLTLVFISLSTRKNRERKD